MHQDSYNQRLKEIRDKYGSTVKETTSCLKTVDRNLMRPQFRYDDKYDVNKKTIQRSYERNNHQNIDPYLKGYPSTNVDPLMQKNQIRKYESSIIQKTNNQDQRLKQIEKIRQNFAESRKKAIDDWNREVDRSKSKYVERQNYSLHDKANDNSRTFNPQDSKYLTKQATIKQHLRNRTQSYSTKRLQQQGLKNKLKRDYDYSTNEHRQNQQQTMVAVRGNPTIRKQRQNSPSSMNKQLSYSSNSKFMKQIDCQSASPIQGLMRYDTLQKTKPVQFPQHSYNLANIDRIQQRIHKILGNK